MPIEDYATLFDTIAADATARRELLWLAAMRNGASDMARELEELEEGLRETMALVVSEYARRGHRFDRPKHRRRAYDKLFEERFRYHQERLALHDQAWRSMFPIVDLPFESSDIN
jgi:hypothetical protein